MQRQSPAVALRMICEAEAHWQRVTPLDVIRSTSVWHRLVVGAVSYARNGRMAVQRFGNQFEMMIKLVWKILLKRQSLFALDGRWRIYGMNLPDQS